MDSLETFFSFRIRMPACRSGGCGGAAVTVLCLVAGLSVFVANSSAAEQRPETVLLDQLVELYDPVMFDHVLHVGMYDCSRCHHHTVGTETEDAFCARCHKTAPEVAESRCSNCHAAKLAATDRTPEKGRYHIDVPSLKGALHLLCRNCHLEESGPVGCVDCHNYSDEGKKRFLVTAKEVR